MNVFVFQGRIVKKAFVVGESRALRFLVLTPYQYMKDGTIRETQTVLPFILFDPPKEMETLLLDPPRGTLYCSGTGHVRRTSYDSHGETRYSTEIEVNRVDFSIRKQ